MHLTIKRFMPIIIKRHSGENPQEVVERGVGEVPETNSSNDSTTEGKCRFKKFLAVMRFKKATTVQSATQTDLLPGDSVVAQEEKVLNVYGPNLILRFGLKEQNARDSLAQLYNVLGEQIEQLKKFIDVWNNQRTSLVKWKLKKYFCIAKLRKIMKVFKSMQKSISKSKTMEDLVATLVKLVQKHKKLVDEQEKHIKNKKWCLFFEKNEKLFPIYMEQVINNVYGQLFAQYECYQKLGQLFKIVVDRNPDLNQKTMKKLKIFTQLTKDIPFIKVDEKLEDERQGCVDSEAATPALLTEIDFLTIGDNLDVIVQANGNQEVNADTERVEGDVIDDADGGDEEVTARSIQISEQMEVLSNLDLLSFEADDDWPSYEEGDELPSFELGDDLPIPPPSPDPFDDDEDESTFEPDPTEEVIEVNIDGTLVANEPDVLNQAPEIQGQEEAVEQDKKDDQLDEKMSSHRNEEKSITQKENINPESGLKENVLDEPTEHIGATKVSTIKQGADTRESALQNIKSNYNPLSFGETTPNTFNNEKDTNPDVSCQNIAMMPQRVSRRDFRPDTATSCRGKSDSNDSHSLRGLKRLHINPIENTYNGNDDSVEQKLKIQGVFLEKEYGFYQEVAKLKGHIKPLIEEMNKLSQDNSNLKLQIDEYLKKFSADSWIDKSCLQTEEKFKCCVDVLTNQSSWFVKSIYCQSEYGNVISDAKINAFTSRMHSPMEERGTKSRSPKSQDEKKVVPTDGLGHYQNDDEEQQYEMWERMVAIIDEGAPSIIKRLESDIFNVDRIVKASRLINKLFKLIYERCKEWEKLRSSWCISKSRADRRRCEILDQLEEERQSFDDHKQILGQLRRQSLANVLR
ncbi:hypothetical protein I9W82_002224 [Candida metapsilosis]|uniref:Uncharacterized protein n=1 Tax=Candida metapsilosis TaxID=273372 RepID=A0A8H7ZEH3_9ASCO|nr:hypothetical protein I9W82_002224 [Candida metapsilosis]